MYTFLTYRETVALLTNWIREQKPFTVTRLGDGEIDTLIGHRRIASKICRAWGYSRKTECKLAFKDLGQVLVTALQKSDILGFLNLQPTKENMLNANRFRADRWAIPEEALVEHGIDLSDKVIIDHQFFRSREFGCMENLQDIVGNTPLHIVSPYAQTVATNLQRFLTNLVRYTQTDRSMFFRERDSEIETIKSNVKDGEVVLFACAGAYKDLGVILRDSVGVSAIDIGATMDAWAGIESRRWFQKGGCQAYLVLRGQR